METVPKTARPQRTEVEIKALLAEHEHSNMTVKEFCELYEISEQTFYNWRNKFNSKIEEEEAFIPLQFPVSTSSLFAEIEVPGKAIFRFFQAVDAAFIKALLQ